MDAGNETHSRISQDGTLLGRARNGDVSAFKSLSKPHIPFLYSLSYRICERANIAEYLTAAIVVRTWESLAELDAESDMEGFLHSRAEQVLRSELRRKNIPGKKVSDFPSSVLRECMAELISSQNLVEPKRSLWPDILGAIETENVAPNDRKKQWETSRKWKLRLLAAAAVAVLIFILPGDNTPPAPDAAIPGENDEGVDVDVSQASTGKSFELPEHIRTLQQEYGKAKTDMVGGFVLDEDSDESIAQQSMVEDLGVVETAINEIITALVNEPENEMLEQMLVTTYVKQMKLLTNAVRLFD